jgi:alanine racemase
MRNRNPDPPIAPRAFVQLDAEALQNNYRAIRELIPGQAILPMVKADAYGHGAVWGAGLLLGMPDLYAFGVATLEEGAELRTGLGPRARKTKIVIFSGPAPWSEEKGQFCERFGLTPAISTDQDWVQFLRGDWPSRIRYELKFNTGMNRLGLSLSQASQIARALRDQPSEHHPDGIFSHLAMSEDTEARLSLSQRERFAALKGELGPAFPAAQFHLANSGGIWNQKHWRLSGLTDAVRPGLSLYGIPPWPGAPARGIRPVMTFFAAVAATRRLKPGESMGYGGAYRVPTQAEGAVDVAILSVGYADGIFRSLSDRGQVWLNDRKTSFLGRVSMDLCAVGASPSTRPGDLAEIIGPRIDLWQQAKDAGTIPYELLTSLSTRVKRVEG